MAASTQLTNGVSPSAARKDLQDLELASVLVAGWGACSMPSGQAASRELTVGGVSLWDIVSASLSVFRLPDAVCRWRQGQPPTVSWSDLNKRRFKRIAFNRLTRIVATAAGCRRTGGNPHAVMLGYSPYIFRDVLAPVAARMAENGLLIPEVFDDALPWGSRRSAFGPVQSIWQHWSPAVGRLADSLQREYWRLIPSMRPTFQAFTEGHSAGLWAHARYLFDWLTLAFWPRMLNHIAVARHVFADHRPRIVVSGDQADPRGRIYVLLARSLGIPTLEIQHGFYGPEAVEWRFFLADKLAVSGDAAGQALNREHGLSQEKIVTTGSPRWDYVAKPQQESKAQLRRRFAIPADQVIAVFASQPFSTGAFASAEIRLRSINALFSQAERNPRLVLIVKPHPLDEIGELKRLGKGLTHLRFADTSEDIRDLIAGSDALVTFFSTVTWDALAARKIVINLAFPGGGGLDLFVRSKATLVATSAQDISACFMRITEGPGAALLVDLEHARSRLIEDWLYKLDGGAARRIEHLIYAVSGLASEISFNSGAAQR